MSIGKFLLVVAALFALGGFSSLSASGIEEEMDEFVRTAVFETPDLGMLEDGTYIGKFRSGVVKAKVAVLMESGRIVAIEIRRHFTGQGQSAEAIVDDVVAAQSLDVDVVSGATYSSNVILKAIEDALSSD